MVDNLVIEGVGEIVALESLVLGCSGGILGLTHVFPQESIAIYKLAK